MAIVADIGRDVVCRSASDRLWRTTCHASSALTSNTVMMPLSFARRLLALQVVCIVETSDPGSAQSQLRIDSMCKELVSIKAGSEHGGVVLEVVVVAVVVVEALELSFLRNWRWQSRLLRWSCSCFQLSMIVLWP